MKTAKAIVAEAGSAVSSSLSRLARHSERNSETAVHATLGEFGLSLAVPTTEVHLKEGSIPCILPSDWFRYILMLREQMLTPVLF